MKYNSNVRYMISYQKILKFHELLLLHFYVKNLMMTH
jgi:hypothetical protein